MLLRRNTWSSTDRTGQDRTGQDRTGQDRTGQDRTGQDRRCLNCCSIALAACLLFVGGRACFAQAVFFDLQDSSLNSNSGVTVNGPMVMSANQSTDKEFTACSVATAETGMTVDAGPMMRLECTAEGTATSCIQINASGQEVASMSSDDKSATSVDDFFNIGCNSMAGTGSTGTATWDVDSSIFNQGVFDVYGTIDVAYAHAGPAQFMNTANISITVDGERFSVMVMGGMIFIMDGEDFEMAFANPDTDIISIPFSLEAGIGSEVAVGYTVNQSLNLQGDGDDTGEVLAEIVAHVDQAPNN